LGWAGSDQTALEREKKEKRKDRKSKRENTREREKKGQERESLRKTFIPVFFIKGISLSTLEVKF
jgi:hypothetical protein